MATLFESALLGSQMVVSSTVYGPIQVDLGAAAQPGHPNPLLTWLRPQVQLYRDGNLLYTWAPYGTPTPLDWETVGLVVLLLGMLLVVARMRSG